MQLTHAITKLEAAVETQLNVAGPEIAAAGTQLMNALKPAITQTMMDVVSMAVAEISSQLETKTVDIRLVDGDPELVVREDKSVSPPPPPPPPPGGEHGEARITLRLPDYLKDIINEAASESGLSINSYVAEALSTEAAKQKRKSGTRHRTTIEL